MADLLTARGSTAFWCSYAAAYDRLWDNQLGSAVADRVLAALPAGERVLEIGAGTGLLTAHLRACGISISATEPQRHMRARLQRRLPDIPVDHRTVSEVCADGFDGVLVLSNVLHLVPDTAGVFQQVLAAASAGVVIVTPSPSASLPSVGRALRSYGATRRYVARFLALHAALAPLSLLSGATRAGFDDSWMGTAHMSWTVGGVQRVVAFTTAAKRCAEVAAT